MKITEAVDRACALTATIKAQQAELECCKHIIRTQAKKDSEGDKVVYNAEGGSAEVVFVKDKTSLKKGVNLTLVTAEIGKVHAAHLFQKKVTIVLNPDFDAAVALLPAPIKAKVLKLVDVEPQEPRVTLK